MLKLGQEKNSPEILEQFSRRLSFIIKRLFSKVSSYSPESSLTVEQLAFTHSLQLYDIKSVMRLAANYDVNKGLKVVLPGIEKSYRSLMVIPQLKPFTKNSKEFSALDAYKSQLEKSLSDVLDCYIEDLYEEDILAEKMIVVSAATESVKKKFFSERLSTLFSSNYRIYLMLKNRYFLHRLKRSKNNSDFNELQKNINSLQKQKAYYLSEIENDSIELYHLQNTKEKQERFAREKFLMKKENEDLFIIRKRRDE